MGTSRFNGESQAGEARYRHLFENLPICIIIVDLTVTPATILEANRQAELVFGYTAAEWMGMPAAHLVPDEARPAVLSIVQQVRQGQTVTVEITNQRRDCTIFPVRVIAAPDPTDAAHMIVAVEDITTKLQRRSEVEAIDAERRRIAHEIHDGVAQSLGGLRFKAGLWNHLAEAANPPIRAALQELQDVLISAIANLRRAIYALRPVDLETQGFFPALAQLVCDFGDHNQLAARLELFGPQDLLPAAYELPLFRIIQEGLNNIDRHAGASLVLLQLTVGIDAGVAVSLCDNGCGFDPSRLGLAYQEGHYGLRQMRERIQDLSGSLDIRSTIGRGTELMISLPPIGSGTDYAAN